MSKRSMPATVVGEYAYRRVSAGLARLIENGTLRAGDRMPSVRELCRRERVSPATVLQAYAELERTGLIEVRERSGHYVRPRSLSHVGAESAPRTLPPDTEPTLVGVSDEVARLLEQAANPALVLLGAAVPAQELLPVAELTRTLTAAARREPEAIGQYSFAGGHPALRRVLAARFVALGCEIAPDEITITAGGMEALNLAVRAVTRPGDIVVVETPGYFGILEILESLGLKALPVPGDCVHGLDLRALAQALEDHPVKAVMLVTSYSNPTGACLTPERRAELVELLVDHGVPLIEDDIYGDLGFGPERPRPAKAWDRAGEVLYCGSFSKSLAPGLRLGWVAAGRFRERVCRLKNITSVGTAGPTQAGLADYLQTQAYDRHLRRLRRAFAHQTRMMREAVLEHFPAGTSASNPEGGCFLWVQLPAGVDATELQRLAAERGVSIAPGPLFCPHGNYRNYVRLGCGLPWTPRIEAAVRTVGELAGRLARPRVRTRK
jgi:Transcriptional regulators containing a DNA-binding HTH domain and an aminotransferase domain (MocR family) and their eukaryotic orthologs